MDFSTALLHEVMDDVYHWCYTVVQSFGNPPMSGTRLT